MTSLPLRLAVLLLPILAPPLAAGIDPASKEFRKLAAAAGKSFRPTVNEQTEALRTDLADLLAQFEAQQSDAATTIEGAVACTGRTLVDLTLAALGVAESLALDGAAILDGGGEGPAPAVSPDFQPGGFGAWDSFRDKLEKDLFRGQDRVRSELWKFLGKFAKAAAQQELDPNPRALFGPLPPLLAGAIGPVGVTHDLRAGGEGFDDDEPRAQVLVEVRFLQVGMVRSFVAGIAFESDQEVGFVQPGNNGKALVPVNDNLFTADFMLETGLGNVFDLVLDPNADDGPLQTLAATIPNTDAPASLAGLTKDLKKALSNESKFLGLLTRNASNGLEQTLKNLEKEQKAGALTTPEALDLGFDALAGVTTGGQPVNAYESIFQWLVPILANPVNESEADFAGAGLGNQHVTSDFVPDGNGLYAGFVAKVQKKLDQTDQKLAKSFERFVVRMNQTGAGEGVRANAIIGRRLPVLGAFFDLGTQPDVIQIVFEPTLKAGMVVVQLTPAVTEASFGGVSANSFGNETLTTLTNQGEEPMAVLDVSTSSLTGTYQGKVPLPSNLPLLGKLFRTSSEEVSKDSTLIFFVTPQIID